MIEADSSVSKTMPITDKDTDPIFINGDELFAKVLPVGASRIPKFGTQDYSQESITERMGWLENITRKRYPYLGGKIFPTENWRGNIENMIGVAQVPIGIAGPLRVQGQYASGDFYVPMATTEGAIVTTYNIGMRLVSSCGGVTTFVNDHGAHISPMFEVASLVDAKNLSTWIDENFIEIKLVAELTTRHGKLVSIHSKPFDGKLVLQFNYFTGDAQGLNMINVATQEACKFISAKTGKSYYIRSNYSGVKKVSDHNSIPNFGKEVHAEARVKNKILEKMKVSAAQIANNWHAGVSISHKRNVMGINCQAVNGIAAIFLACGQDIADLSSSHIAYSNFIADQDGLRVQIYIPSLTIGTVGGGTGKSTQRECLEIMNCYGSGKVNKFAEIIAATVLAGELATVIAIGNDTFVYGHSTLGRNKPDSYE